MTSWVRSSRCDTGSCVDVWPGHATVWVRDSAGQTLVVDRAAWATLVRHVRETS